ncbi:glycerol-3-phosphate dehydrogenase [Ignatzschineria ureiclastica]|uniref:Glycerol-3-phosphate dehydrogenase n=1 Tax=Ignatzschineria ureiclastica TaxID=472582 RepID=A0A2U2AFM6_9GAMM|nr:glycerol-3-phosphate dehydrogenase/oxidase [Ignatzschineria ureiclastica]PWD81468.1 glycerol-3-phosphate dehydrogenase [Ignatzschineria ureiclastica]GHA00887.1 aerobic glycerol-3-phosphate dehydrogenase [Ignatzschineria ureiclastica]
MKLASKSRRKHYQQLRENHYDLIIIGGGISGAAIALDAVTRGMKVVLLEKQDFGFGASSRSTKLIHGGLRYLQSFQLKQVTHSGEERALLYENAPHLVTRRKMLIPFYKGGSFGKIRTAIGLRLYDYLAKVKADERQQIHSKSALLSLVPALTDQGLKGAGEYVEYVVDDARLTLEIIKKAMEKGAHCFNYLAAIDFNYDDKGYIEGVVARDQLTGNRYLIEGDFCLNATGAWRQSLLAPQDDHAIDSSTATVKDQSVKDQSSTDRSANNSLPDSAIKWIKGAHIVFDQTDFPLKEAVCIEIDPQEEGAESKRKKEMVMAIPYAGKTYVGVSQSEYEGNVDMPTISVSDQGYLLSAMQRFFPSLHLTSEMIESSWAGVMPIVAHKGASSKKGQPVSALLDEAENGLLTLMSGKLTGYRSLAQAVVDELASKIMTVKQRQFKPCQTAQLTVSGGDVGGSAGLDHFLQEAIKRGETLQLSEEESRALAIRYGSNVEHLFTIAEKATPEVLQGLPLLLYTQLYYSVTEEGVMTPCDFFIRRLGALYFDIDLVKNHRVAVVEWMARYFGWSIAEVKRYNAELEQALYQATHAVEDDRIVKITHQTDDNQSQNRISKDAEEVGTQKNEADV